MSITARFFTLKKPWQQKSTTANADPTSAHIRVKQSNLLEAQDLYRKGLSSGQLNDAQRVQLQKEMDSVTATIRRYNQQLYLVPCEVWNKVFQHISEQHDLIHCASAFTPWSNIIITMMPDLWSPPWRIKRQGYLVSVFDTKLSTIRIDEPGFYEPDSKDKRWLEGLFDNLSHWSDNRFETLAIEFLVITSPLIRCIAKALKTIEPSFSRFVFRLEGTLSHTDVKDILDSCSRIEHMLLECTLRNHRITSDLISIELSALTHLKLIFRNFDGMALMPQVIRQCPNLVHLLVCAEGHKYRETAAKRVYTSYYRTCMEQALEHCSQLKTLQVAEYAWFWRHERRKVFLLPDNDYGLAEKHGVHTLNYSYWWIPDDIRFIANNINNSLETLCLDYKFYKAKRTDLSPLLPLCGAPNMRRVALEMAMYFGKSQKLSLSLLDDMIAFFSATPTLEEVVLTIKLYDMGRSGSEKKEIAIREKTRDLLLAIARNCRALRAFTNTGRSYTFTDDIWLEFAAEVGPNLTHLEVNAQATAAHRMKIILPKLVHFEILKSESMPTQQIFNVHSWPYIDNTLIV